MNKSKEIAEIILQGFNDHFRIFSEITAGAQHRFETADWKAERENSRLRIQFYDTRVDEAITVLRTEFEIQPFSKNNWSEVKSQFILLLQNH